MKTPRVTALIVAALLSLQPTFAGEPASTSSPFPTLEALTTALPADPQVAAKALWTQFNLTKHSDTPVLLLRDWTALNEQFAGALVAKAREQGFEADALKAILAESLASRGSLALVPVSAHRATLGGKPVWAVVQRWEIEMKNPPVDSNIRLGHVRLHLYDIATRKPLASETCL